MNHFLWIFLGAEIYFAEGGVCFGHLPTRGTWFPSEEPFWVSDWQDVDVPEDDWDYADRRAEAMQLDEQAPGQIDMITAGDDDDDGAVVPWEPAEVGFPLEIEDRWIEPEEMQDPLPPYTDDDTLNLEWTPRSQNMHNAPAQPLYTPSIYTQTPPPKMLRTEGGRGRLGGELVMVRRR